MGETERRPRDSGVSESTLSFDRESCVLVLAGDAPDAERTLLAPDAGEGFVAVGVTVDPAVTVERYRGRTPSPSGPCAAIRVGPSAGGETLEDVPVESVNDPANLTTVGTTITSLVDDWEPGWQLWFDSLGPLVHYTDAESLYRFVDVLGSRAAREDATAFVRLNPAASDDRTVQQMMAAADAAARADDDGWRVRRRR